MLRITISLFLLAALAGCDNEPNPDFQKSVDDRNAARAGDPYADMNRLPRLYSYSNAKPEQKQATATSSAATLAATYQSMLEKLDGDKDIDPKLPFFAACRADFDKARAFQSDPATGGDATAKGAELFAALTTCRDQAIAAEKEGGAQEATANLARRFASAGMALVGMAVTAKGDAENGLRLWREGDALATKDRPGFKLKVESLRGY